MADSNVKCNGCGRFLKWDAATETWPCEDCAREYDAPPPKYALAPPAAPQGSPLPAEVLAVIRDPRVPLEGEEGAANIVLARGCKSCLRADRPYWHQAGTPCPLASTTASAQGSPLPGGDVAPAKPWMCRCPRAAGIQRIGSSNGLGPPLKGPWACIVCNTPVISGAPLEGGALEGEMATALHDRITDCSCCGNCPMCESDRALLARYNEARRIPQSGTVKEGV